MPFVIPSVTTRDRVKAIFQSKVVRPHEELLEWLDEVVPEILSSISGEKQHDFAVPKTPRQKAKTRTRAAQKVPLNLDDLKPISLRSMRYETRLRKKSSSIRKSKSVKLTNAKVSLICEALASLDDNDKTPIATKRQESPLLIDLDKTLNEENEPVAIEPPRKVFRTKKVITQEEQHENLLKSPENGIDQLKITRKTRSIRSKKDENIAHITEIREQQTAASTILEPLVVAGEEVMRRESISPIKENEPNQSKRSKLDQIDRPKSNDLFFDDRPKIQDKKPSAQIVLTKSPVNDVRTTRSKARQKVQNENHNKDEGVMKPNQIPNLKISSASSSSSSTLTTMSGMKTPSTLTKTSKYFNTLISNSGLKNKT
uniref:Uncharacterized protein n=1 Tax=Romanomermis culicivorax TaxID=13658 RepID=A0A915IP93_ROMCU